jgi:hypothetical protein
MLTHRAPGVFGAVPPTFWPEHHAGKMPTPGAWGARFDADDRSFIRADADMSVDVQCIAHHRTTDPVAPAGAARVGDARDLCPLSSIPDERGATEE